MLVIYYFFPLLQLKETIWHVSYLYSYFNRPSKNRHNGVEFQVVLLASGGVIFGKRSLSNFQISISENNLQFDSSPSLLVSLCSFFPTMLRFSFSFFLSFFFFFFLISDPDSPLFDSCFFPHFIISLYLLCRHTGYFHPLSFGLLQSGC